MSSVSVAVKRQSLARGKFFVNKYALLRRGRFFTKPFRARTCRGVKTTETPLLLITVLIEKPAHSFIRIKKGKNVMGWKH
jgi:hypothetical protein